MCPIAVLLFTILAAFPAFATEVEPLDLESELQAVAAKQLFFAEPEADVRYVARDQEYWGTGFDEGGLAEKYPSDQWGAFELAGLEAGRSRAVAMIAINDSSRELIDFLEEGDALTLSLAYKDRLEYMWTDAVLDTQETRELVLFEVETLSYSLPRVEGYSVLWYDHRAPDKVTQRTHLSQDVLPQISRPTSPGTELEIELEPGNIAVLFVPEGDYPALPLTFESEGEGTLVFGVLAGRMGMRVIESGVPSPGDRGDKVVRLEIPVDHESRKVFLVRDQPSITFYILHVPQGDGPALKLKMVVGEVPAAEPTEDSTDEPAAPAK